MVRFEFRPDKPVYRTWERVTIIAWLDTRKCPPSRCVYGAMQVYIYDRYGTRHPSNSTFRWQAGGYVDHISITWTVASATRYRKFNAFAVFVDASGRVVDEGWSETKWIGSVPKHKLTIRVVDAATREEIAKAFEYSIKGRTLGFVARGTGTSGLTLEVPEDTYEVEVAIPGYLPARATIRVDRDIVVRIELEAAPPKVAIAAVKVAGRAVEEGGEVAVPVNQEIPVEVAVVCRSGRGKAWTILLLDRRTINREEFMIKEGETKSLLAGKLKFDEPGRYEATIKAGHYEE